MSAFLLGLGFRADMGTCVRKLVLLKLIDACEDDGTRIFPAVATVARAAQCSTRQVQREIRAFCDAGLLRVVREGGRGRRSTNEYALDLDVLAAISASGWAGFVGGRGADADDEAKGDTESPLDGAAKGDTGDALRVTRETPKGDKLSHPTPPDSSEDPSAAREARAREGDQEDQGKKDSRQSREADEKRFWRLARNHPQSAGMPKSGWLTEWRKLTDDEKDRAERRYPAWLILLKGQGKSHVPALSTYFAQKLFDEVPDEEPEKPPERLPAKPFGKLWQAARLAKLIEGPLAHAAGYQLTAFEQAMVKDGKADRETLMAEKRMRHGFPAVTRLDELAASMRPALAGAWLAPLAEDFEPVKVDGELWAEWREAYVARGWPWMPDTGRHEWVYFPKGGPAGLEAFERAVRETRGADGSEQASEAAE